MPKEVWKEWWEVTGSVTAATEACLFRSNLSIESSQKEKKDWIEEDILICNVLPFNTFIGYIVIKISKV